MTYRAYLGSDRNLKIHRKDCTATDGCYVESVQHVYRRTYDTVQDAVNGLLDIYRFDTVTIDAAPCCDAIAADFQSLNTVNDAYRIVSPARSRFARRN